jgi:hypothetical protein
MLLRATHKADDKSSLPVGSSRSGPKVPAPKPKF